MSTQLIDEGDLINEMNNEQKRAEQDKKWVKIWGNSCFLFSRTAWTTRQIYYMQGKKEKKEEKLNGKTEWKNMNSRGDKSDLNGCENYQRALYINGFAYISYIRKM